MYKSSKFVTKLIALSVSSSTSPVFIEKPIADCNKICQLSFLSYNLWNISGKKRAKSEANAVFSIIIDISIVSNKIV